MNQEQLIILKTFMYPSEAYALVSKLESEGIICFLDGENTILVHPFLSNAIGGVKLKIRESDLKAALALIEETERNFAQTVNQSEKPIPEKFSKGFVKVETFCPDCDSINVFRKKMHPQQILLAILLLPLYLPLLFLTKNITALIVVMNGNNRQFI
ncbi:MAG: DUF2007 domain-containing protein [Bacteroidales bacterium]|nr:DUF2007 domain-containing protein [Bacteroidales bacterium]